MRIGIQCGQFPTKSETWIVQEANGLRAKGHEVVISASNHLRDLSTCDFVVCHFANMAGRAEAHRRPFLLVPHAYDIWPTNGAFLKEAVRKCAHLAAVGCISSYHRERYLDWGIPERLLVDHPCAVDVDLFYRKTGEPLGELVVHGGRDVTKKGFGLAREAWPNVTLFGDAKGGVGWLSPQGLRDLYANAWCYLGTFQKDERGDMDGLPVALLEAACMKLRLVVCNIAGIRDLAGIATLVEPDPKRLREAVLSEPHTPNELGAQYVRERHDPSVVAERIISLAIAYGG